MFYLCCLSCVEVCWWSSWWLGVPRWGLASVFVCCHGFRHVVCESLAGLEIEEDVWVEGLDSWSAHPYVPLCWWIMLVLIWCWCLWLVSMCWLSSVGSLSSWTAGMLQVPAFLSYLFDAWLLSSWMHLDMMDQSPDKNIRNVIQIITSPTMMPSRVKYLLSLDSVLNILHLFILWRVFGYKIIIVILSSRPPLHYLFVEIVWGVGITENL